MDLLQRSKKKENQSDIISQHNLLFFLGERGGGGERRGIVTQYNIIRKLLLHIFVSRYLNSSSQT